MRNTQEIVLLSNDKALRKLVRSKLRETGLEVADLLRDEKKSRPRGLTIGTIIKWMNGSTKLTRKDHLDWLIDQCDQRIAKRNIDRKMHKRIPINPEMRALFLSEVERTQMGAIRILRLAPQPLPEGLNTQKIQCWISGNTKTAKKTHWDFVMRLYASIDTKTS